MISALYDWCRIAIAGFLLGALNVAQNTFRFRHQSDRICSAVKSVSELAPALLHHTDPTQHQQKASMGPLLFIIVFIWNIFCWLSLPIIWTCDQWSHHRFDNPCQPD